MRVDRRTVCPSCGYANSPYRVTCKNCRGDLNGLLAQEQERSAQAAHAPLSLEARRDLLDREIARYIQEGFRVLSRTDTTAQLVKPKTFSLVWFLIWMLLLIGWLFYVAYYLAKRDETIYLEVTPGGRVRRTLG